MHSHVVSLQSQKGLFYIFYTHTHTHSERGNSTEALSRKGSRGFTTYICIFFCKPECLNHCIQSIEKQKSPSLKLNILGYRKYIYCRNFVKHKNHKENGIPDNLSTQRLPLNFWPISLSIVIQYSYDRKVKLCIAILQPTSCPLTSAITWCKC